MRRFASMWAVFLFTTCAVPMLAHAQNVQTSLTVNYGSAYRNGAWVPIDLFAVNRGSAIEGELVVTLRDAVGNAQSPVHRVPIDLPTNSSKRFRVTCFLENVDKVETRIFHHGREVKDTSIQVTVPPIRANDLLGLILDERPEDYAFLSDLYLGENAPRFYRESLTGDAIAALSDNPRCYDSFDIIILGDMDPARLTGPQRGALSSFVGGGGTLVALTGVHSPAYRDSWVQKLAQVAIGDTQYIPASEFAIASLGEAKGANAPADVSASIAGLAPEGASVQRLGLTQTLATRTPIGSGTLILLANDQKTQALEACPGYLDLWRSIAQRRAGDPDLNWPIATRFLSAAMPAMAGVQMLPRSSVLTYLVVYFVVGVVLNWAFWTWRKRREMAWVCLIFFSAGFTAYAMLYGTAGRARESQMFQFDLVAVQGNTAAARVDSILGVISSGSARYTAELPLPASLLTDLSATHGVADFDPFNPRGRRAEVRPVNVIDSEPPRLDDMRIGASDSRLLQVSSETTLEGGFEGVVTASSSGARCRIKNNTGFAISQARLFFDGTWYPLRVEEDGMIAANYVIGEGNNNRNNSVVNNFALNQRSSYDDMEYMFLYGDDGNTRPLPKPNDVAPRLIDRLFSRQAPVQSFMPMPSDGPGRRYQQPLLVAITDRPVVPAITTPGIALKGGTTTFLATLPLIDERTERTYKSTLPLTLDGASKMYAGNYGTPYWPGEWREIDNENAKYSAWNEETIYLNSEDDVDFVAYLADVDPSRMVDTYLVDTYAHESDGNYPVVVRVDVEGGPATEYEGTKVGEITLPGTTLTHRHFEVPVLTPYRATSGMRETMQLRLKSSEGRGSNDYQQIQCSVECSLKQDETSVTKQEPIPWQ